MHTPKPTTELWPVNYLVKNCWKKTWFYSTIEHSLLGQGLEIQIPKKQDKRCHGKFSYEILCCALLIQIHIICMWGSDKYFPLSPRYILLYFCKFREFSGFDVPTFKSRRLKGILALNSKIKQVHKYNDKWLDCLSQCQAATWYSSDYYKWEGLCPKVQKDSYKSCPKGQLHFILSQLVVVRCDPVLLDGFIFSRKYENSTSCEILKIGNYFVVFWYDY